MCDPTVLAVGSLVAGVAGTAADYVGQMGAQKDQEQAYNDWAATQRQNRAAASAKDEADRRMADAARVQGLQDVSADSQKATQANEQARLTSYLQGQQDQPADQATGATPVSVADTRLSGQQSGDATFQSDLAGKLSKASNEAKQRIAALATVGSYGGSSGGLDVSNALAFSKAGRGIDLGNEFRRGDLGVYGTQQAVNPLQYSYTKSPLAPLASNLMSFGAQGLGTKLGSMMSNAVRV
jgi:hypothetical protein